MNESAEDLKYIFEDVTFNIQSNGDLNKSWCLSLMMEKTHLNKMKIIIYISELLNLYQFWYKSAFHICYFLVYVRIGKLSSETLSHLAFCNTWTPLGYC